MKGLALVVLTMELLRAQPLLTLPAAIQNPFRFTPPGTVVAAGFDATDNLYLAGSAEYFEYTGAPFVWPSMTTFLSPIQGVANFYVMKISGPSTPTPQVVYITGIGGAGLGAMAVDPTGNIYLAGYTSVSDFPTTPGSFQTSSATGGGFLLKLDPSGKKLVYSTLLDRGGTAINALAIDANGNAYVGGGTSGVTFPTTAGAFQSTNPPPQAAGEIYSVGFVSEFDPNGAKLLYSTLIGEPSSEVTVYVEQIGVDSTGAIHISGGFGYGGGHVNFPFTANAAYSSGPGFLAILSKTNPSLLYSTPLPFIPNGMEVDGSGDSYLGGSGLLKITYAGTIGYYAPNATGPFLVLSDGTAVVAGTAGSPNFPTRNTLMPCAPNLPQFSAAFSGSLYDSATLTMFDPSGNITFSTLLGGADGDAYIAALALDPNGALHVIGLVMIGPDLANSTGSTVDEWFPGGPIIDGSSGTEFAFMLNLSTVPQGLPAPSCLASGANFGFAPAVAGAVTTLFGSNLGPTIGVQYRLDANGLVPAQLDGTTITVGGVPAPILYAQDTQVNFIVPQHISGSTTNVCVTRSGVQSCIFAFTAQESPALFCVSLCDNAPLLAVLNQDGSLNSSSNPAAAGSVLQIFGTGMGPYGRSLPDGGIVQLPFANLASPVSAVFYGQSTPCGPFSFMPCYNPAPSFPATVLFAGAAPLEVVGVDQVNVLIPEAAVAGQATTLTLYIGNGGVSAYVSLK